MQELQGHNIRLLDWQSWSQLYRACIGQEKQDSETAYPAKESTESEERPYTHL